MYYRLAEPWSFRGWKKLPYALRAEYGSKKHDKPRFFYREQFLALLCCNGEENTDPAALGEDGRRIIERLAREGVLEQSEAPLPPLKPWQRYRVFPSRFLQSAHWSITGRCNYHCRHCLVSAPEARHPQLPLEACLHIVEELAACGIRLVDITGGEPLVRGDFEEIVKALTAHDIDIGVLFTNASLLSTDTLDMLEKHRQHPAFQLSFDGLGHHDWLRGVSGAEKAADAAFRLLRERRYAVNSAMCLHRGNRDCLHDTVRYLAALGVTSLRVNAPQMLGVWKQYAEEYALTEEEVWAVYRDCIASFFEDGMPMNLELDGYFSGKKGKTDYTIPYVHPVRKGTDWSRYPYCETMRYHVYIGPEGRLGPCMGFSDTALWDRFPSILEHSLGELTLQGCYHDVVETRVSDLLAKNPGCETCEHLPKCMGGCMVEGITEDGDYLVPDSRCCCFHRQIGEKAVREAADAAIREFCGN